MSGLILAACTRSAFAADGCSGDKPWVAVSGDLPAAFADAVRSDLRAGLAPSSIDVCRDDASSATEALARVSIAPVAGGDARYNLEVTDSVTRKRVERQLSLEIVRRLHAANVPFLAGTDTPAGVAVTPGISLHGRTFTYWSKQ